MEYLWCGNVNRDERGCCRRFPSLNFPLGGAAAVDYISTDATEWTSISAANRNDLVPLLGRFAAITTLGFDLEWRAAQRTGDSPGDVATIQLYGKQLGEDRGIGALIHVTSLGYTHKTDVSEGNPFPPELTQLLRTKKLTGCNIANDVGKLANFGCIVPQGNLVKLETLIHEKLRIPPLVHPDRWSLGKLCLRVAKKELDKKLCHAEGSRRVNWERFPLAEHERQYAMNDAFASWLIFDM